jgi:hypothetical protein
VHGLAVGSKNARHRNSWVRFLTYITGLVNQELLLQNEYLAAENRILPAQLPARLRLSDLERTTLAEIGKRLGRKALDIHDKGLSREKHLSLHLTEGS